jgi:hypothetical protein
MINKNTSFKKKGKRDKSKGKKGGKIVVAPEKKTKTGPKPKTECFYYKGTRHWKRNCPKYLADKNDRKVSKVYMIYMLLMCTLLVLAIIPGYLILVQLLTYVTRNKG